MRGEGIISCCVTRTRVGINRMNSQRIKRILLAGMAIYLMTYPGRSCPPAPRLLQEFQGAPGMAELLLSDPDQPRKGFIPSQTGIEKTLVILVEFQDVKAFRPASEIGDAYFSDTPPSRPVKPQFRPLRYQATT